MTEVSGHLVEHCLLGMLKNKTRILVTHHVEIAKHADLILIMDEGRIIQQGPYDTLREVEGIFKTLMDEYGNAGTNSNDTSGGEHSPSETLAQSKAFKEETCEVKLPGNTKDTNDNSVTQLHSEEERQTGAVSGRTYLAYLKALFRGEPFVVAVIALILTECGSIALTLMLSFWATLSVPGFSQGQYMGIYTGLGVTMAAFAFVSSYAISLCGLGASFLMAQVWHRRHYMQFSDRQCHSMIGLHLDGSSRGSRGMSKPSINAFQNASITSLAEYYQSLALWDLSFTRILTWESCSCRCSARTGDSAFLMPGLRGSCDESIQSPDHLCTRPLENN